MHRYKDRYLRKKNLRKKYRKEDDDEFKGNYVIVYDDEHIDKALRAFKKMVEQSGVMRELKNRQYGMSKRQKKRAKAKRAEKRLQKALREERRAGTG